MIFVKRESANLEKWSHHNSLTNVELTQKQEIGPSRSRPTKPGKLLLHGSRTSRYGEAHEHRPNINDRCTR